MDNLEHELKHLIVEALMLEDVRAEDIDPEAPLFGEGLGLDSIDALELAMVIDKKYGARIQDDDQASRQALASIRALAGYIREHRRAPD